ncbi:MAG: alanine--glyoxylate aminotransferase family protein [Actinobacteria bacterium]|nr:alanine--glyoxylate aminotransferase family protein [Actinomycetota bacterium]
MIKKFLMTPGPTQIPSEVLLASAQPIIHHRTGAYSDLFARVNENLKYVYQTQNEVISFASSGTGAMESAVVNLCSPGDKVLIASCGKFGERWRDLSQVYGLDYDYREYEWGTAVIPGDIEAALAADPDIKAVFVTHSETSTGVVNDMEAIGAAVAKSDAVLVSDSISGMGSSEIKTDAWGIDVVVAGSQKALMIPPGLAFVSVSAKAWALVEKSTLPKYYFDWTKARKALAQDKPTTAFTPAVSLVVGLDKALSMIREEGLDNLFQRHITLGRATRAAVKGLGLTLFSPDDDRCSSVTSVLVPEGVDEGKLRTLTRDKYGVQMAGGQGHIKGKIFRIGHCGYYNYTDIIVAITALELALKELGHPVELGSGVSKAQAVFGEEMV